MLFFMLFPQYAPPPSHHNDDAVKLTQQYAAGLLIHTSLLPSIIVQSLLTSGPEGEARGTVYIHLTVGHICIELPVR